MTTQKDGLELLVNSVADIARGRALYASGGVSSNTKRTNLYDEFGYPTRLVFRNFYDTYERNAVAHSAVHRLLDDCWQDKPTIIDGDESHCLKLGLTSCLILKRYQAAALKGS